MATIGALLRETQLPDSPSARLDVELLLAAALDKPRSYLRTWPEKLVPREALVRFQADLERRRQGEPVAYILGQQGFWSLDLEVSPDTLIPRPDTEVLVETVLALPLAGEARVLDLGTGTGAIALALAHERPRWTVLGVDRIPEAVELARRNAERLRLDNVRFAESHWFSALEGQRFALIVSNPPYIAGSNHHLDEGDVRFEPRSALVAGADGLDDIRELIAAAPAHLQPGGWLWLEHGFEQAGAVRELLVRQGFAEVESRCDLGSHQRISGGRWPC